MKNKVTKKDVIVNEIVEDIEKLNRAKQNLSFSRVQFQAEEERFKEEIEKYEERIKINRMKLIKI